MYLPFGICRVIAVGFVIVVSSTFAFAQGTPADYERAERLSQLTQNKVFRTSVVPHWDAKGDRFWYRVDLANGEREFVAVDAIKGTRALAFDHAKLAEALSKLRKAEVSAKKLPLEQLALDPIGANVRFNAFGKRFECKLPSYELREVGMEAPTTSLKSLNHLQATQRTGDRTTIRFVNQRKEPINLFWIDSENVQQPYGTIAAGQENQMQTYAGHVWLITDAKKKIVAVFEATEGGGQAIVTADMVFPDQRPARSNGNTSPDGKWTAVFKDHNIFLKEVATGKETALSKEGTAADGYSGLAHWSPDSSRLIALRTTRVEERKIPLVESSPRDQVQPKLQTITYVKPGDVLSISKPHLFDVAKLAEISVTDDLFKNPWSISQLRWDRDGREFSFLFNQRGHQTLRLVGIDGQTGKTWAIIDETSKTFVDYAGKFYLREIEETGEIIWMSERDGWNHLYRIDRKTGAVKNPITKGDWVVRGVERVDVEKRQIWFRAGGIHADQDPYQIHFARINFDGTGLVVLTKGDGSHTIQYSPDGRYLIDSYSRVDLPAVTELRKVEDGSLVCPLETGDASALKKAGWQMPERFVAKARDGKTDIFGVIYRPTNFDPTMKYPVIEAIYAGPHSSFVPKEFRSFYRAQTIAELGFIVVQIDGMGTSNRSKAFHDVCAKNLGDSGFPDRILWMKAAAEKYKYMDISRVGIYGGSAGGQSALRALLAHGDFYKVAVADCGCHDNRVDKIWWNELWMGYPIGPHYREQSNVTNAHKLTGKLLLTVGELDKNVDPASTMQVVNALIKAGKDFDLIVFPGAGHGIGESPYGARRRMDFFVQHLLDVRPPDRNAK